MRRLRNDLPYRFRGPQWRPWFRPAGLWANRTFFLERKYRIEAIRDAGFAPVIERVAAGDAVILAPNHADHADPHVMLELGGRLGLDLHFMAAREIFEVSAGAAWALQSMGVFSVDRDGPDLSSIKTALSLLDQGKPLVIYPEGEIYHHHERLDPLHEGVASILLKAAAKLPENRQAWLVPVGIRFRHGSDVEATFVERLSRLEDRIGWTPRTTMPVDERIIRLGRGVLALKETEFLDRAGQGDIQERLTLLCETLLGEVESRCGRDAKARTAPERVRALRYRLRRRLLDDKEAPDFQQRCLLLDDLDRIFTALQAHSYIGDYLLERPSLDRRAETILKLEEDLLGFPTYPTPRQVTVEAGEMIPVSRMLRSGEIGKKDGAAELTALLERRLSGLIGLGPEEVEPPRAA